MATQEKLHKSLEALKNLSNSNQPPDPARKKEKIQHCHIVTEAFSNPTIKVSTNIQVLLGITFKTFLKLCDDPESDIRMTSDECLNRIIRAVSDGHIGKVQIELHKEIKTNGSARSLRAALSRFSQLVHHIRPHKGKPYVVNLLPSIIKIADRTEESIHETLAISLPKILSVLGCFMSDSDVKALLKAFLHNVIRPSAAIRRTSSSCILSICMRSRRPYVFVTHCITYLLDMIIPVDSNQNSATILGILHCLKTLLPSLKSTITTNEGFNYTKDFEVTQPIPINRLLQVYELCLYYFVHSDHNIVNAALDTLNLLLLNAPTNLQEKLLNPNGIDRCRIHKSLSINNIRSPSQLSVATNATSADENLFPELDLTESIQTDIEKWIGESKLSVINMSHAGNIDKTDSIDTFTILSDGHDFGNGTKMPETFGMDLKSSSIADNMDKLSDRSSEISAVNSENENKILGSNNEFHEVNIGDYLDKSTPLLYCSRLIAKSFLLCGVPNKYISDKNIRVSVKASALSCLSSIFKIYPTVFFKYLDKHFSESMQGNSDISHQKIADIMLFADHPDPQLRGNLRSLLSELIASILAKSNLNFDLWITDLLDTESDICKDTKLFDINEFIAIFVKGLQDENSNCLRQTLLCLNPTLNLIAESTHCDAVLPILNILPFLGTNPYWLVKVALCELVSKISYVTIYHITGDSHFQNKVLHHILLELLKDSDERIRNAASLAIVEIIENLYYLDQHPKQITSTTKGIHHVKTYLKGLYDTKLEDNLHKTHFIKNMPFPYSGIADSSCDNIEYSLSIIIRKLYSIVLTTNSKSYIHGGLKALSLLSSKYPCTIYKQSCNTESNRLSVVDVASLNSAQDILRLCINLLTSSVHSYDIPFMTSVLNLAANTYAGHAVSSLKPMDLSENKTKTWSMFSNDSMQNLSDQYLVHTIKLLNIFHHVINDTLPSLQQGKTILPHLPSTGTLSPIKRRKSTEDRKLLMGPGKIVLEKEEKAERKEGGKGIVAGCFAGSQHYMKIFEVVRSAFVNYKTSLDPNASENFLELMRKTLHTLSIILEISTLNEFGRISEEILNYLKTTFTLDPTMTVQCVQQLLKCLFGTNLTANVAEILDENKTNKEDEDFSFYHNIFQKPYAEMSSCIHSLGNISKIECDGDNTVMGYLHRKDVKKPTTIARTSDKTLANYIKIFEPIVIKSLKQYTVTSNVKLQCCVLQLLSQLVQLRVNYCLLDSELVFKGFVLNQFEYIEEGLGPCPDGLISQIFQFLVHLSYSKQHSKSIIGIPKIIQLCDGLMASGQDPTTHCIPALDPIVEDVFLIRCRSNTTDMKELETTREVVLSMLLRLLEYKEVIDLVTLVLDDSKYCTDDTEKWLRWSGQVVNVFLQLLRQNKIGVNDTDTFSSLVKFVFALNPNVFRPEDDVIVMLFQTPPPTENDIVLERWLSKVIILLLIISPLKEDDLITKINTLKATFSPGSIFENFTIIADPLNVYNNADTFRNVSGEAIIARLIFRVITVVSRKIAEEGTTTNVFLVNQFSVFLMYCSYIFQSGSLCKVSKVAISLLNEEVANSDINILELNKIFIYIGNVYPTVTFQWCHILSVLNHNDIGFWNHVIIGKSLKEYNSINNCIVKTGATIVLCDYLSENTSESKQLYWVLSKNSEKLINLVEELPVSEFISFVHRNASLSKLFVECISQKCLNIQDPIFKTKMVRCVENSHVSQTGAAFKLLIPKMLSNRLIAVSRQVANLASRKVEFLFTLSIEEVNGQLSKEELFIIKEELNVMNLAKKHETLINLLNKLLVQFYDMSPVEFNQKRAVNPEYIRKLDINKKWYLSQIQGKYQDGMLRKEIAKVMQILEYNELSSFLSSEDFNKIIYRDCIDIGVKALKENGLPEEPPILKATVDNLLKEVSKIVNEVCANHEVFDVEKKRNSYTPQILQSFQDETFSTLLLNLCYSVSVLIKCLFDLPTLQLSEIDSENISKFAVVALEYVQYLITIDKNYLNINYLEVLLECANEILKQSQFSGYLGLDSNISWLCSGINSLHALISFLLKNDEPLPLADQIMTDAIDIPILVYQAGKSCQNLYSLVSWLYKIQNKYVNIPIFLLGGIKSLIVSLSRLPLVISYNLIPSRVWNLGWQPKLTGKFRTQVSPLPIDMLQEIDVLEEYIFRMTLLGWTTRQQFEETWMCFLSVLCTPLDDLDSVDVNCTRRASSLAIKAITALLLQTLRYPVLGNKNVSKIMHVSRNAPITTTAISLKKLKIVQDHIENKYAEVSNYHDDQEVRNVFTDKNFEKVSEQYSYGQISIRFFMIATNSDKQTDGSFADVMYRKRAKLLEDSGLDVNSCLQFLIDYYSQLMKAESAITDLRILHETIRSTLFISDLFTDKSQFSWMLDMFLDLSKIHAVEDELIHQYLIVGICKAVGVLTPELEIFEQIKKVLVQFLKSPFLPSRISCLYGILYILEGCILSKISIGGISEELQLILPCAVEYVQQHILSTAFRKSQEHTLLVWAVAFYLIENVDDMHMESNFVASTLQSAFTVLQIGQVNGCVKKCIIKGLERLLVIKPLYILEKIGKLLQKLAMEKIRDENPSVSILGVQLLVSYMYADCWEHLEKIEPDTEQSSPDHLVQTIEKISAIFERIKKSYVVEVEVLCSVLPMILRDFFSPSDILTKVIGEFLSPQQPHPRLMSEVVFQVFESAIHQKQLSLLQDWVVFSLSSFTQSYSNMATWCLTCFFISASSNKWLRSYFPFIQSRVGRCDYEDKKIFCIAGSDFYRNLESDKQRQTFVDNFMKVKNHLDMPFSDLLSSL